MSNKDLCIEIINNFEEEQLKNIAVMLQGVKNMVAQASDEAYCLKLIEDYENDKSADKSELMSLKDFSKEIGIDLR
ncbi:MAG: hypothetical protein FWD34_08650 [Oscillospiraceae bacterium]|nr:hypothetical protein [Oscillospiraceae bacterium]